MLFIFLNIGTIDDTTQVNNNDKRKDVVIQLSLISFSPALTLLPSYSRDYTYWNLSGDFCSFGIGGNNVIIGTKLLEFFMPSQAVNAFGVDVSMLPICLYVISGLQSGRSMRKPIVYAYGSVNLWCCDVPTETPLSGIMRAGLGLKWTLWIVSMKTEADWYHDVAHGRHSNVVSLRVGAEVGGWWTASDISKTVKTPWGNRVVYGCTCLGLVSLIALLW